jgi:PAS domain S-box-containing protein
MEDDPGQARLMQRVLERAGYTVELAHDGNAGVALYEAGAYDVLVVDHQMPGKGGLEVLRLLATRGALPAAVMVTGHGDEAVAVEALQVGAGDYVVKDVEGRFLTLLPTVLERTLYRRRLLEDKQRAEEALRQTLAELEVRVRERTAALQQANAHLQAEIAERQRAEAALAKEHDFVAAVLDTVATLVVVLDTQGRIVRFNRACEQTTGYAADEVQGRYVWDLFLVPEEAEGVKTVFQKLRSGQFPNTHENFWVTRDGRRRLIAWSNTVLLDTEGAVEYVIGTGLDITERRRAEQEMQRADRLALVGQLASGLAHEIGTPLNVIAGNAELLHMELYRQGITTAAVETIVEQADRITRLIERLLTFARAKEQPAEPLALHVPLAHVLRLLEARFRHDAVSVIVDVPANLPLVWGAADQLEQVFLNVLVNAWHAMPTGGTVTIRACTRPHQQVQIAFQDTGSGIAPADLARVFEPFYSTKGEHGTGLGLAICRQIIDGHQGTIALASTPGVGTTVTITLPGAQAMEHK